MIGMPTQKEAYLSYIASAKKVMESLYTLENKFRTEAWNKAIEIEEKIIFNNLQKLAQLDNA